MIPTSSLLAAVFWYFPATVFYHAMYYRQLMKAHYDKSISGPTILRKGTMKKMFPEMPPMHKNYGVVMHEGQMCDARMNIQSLLTASVDKFIPGMKGATLANYVELRALMKDKEGRINGAKLFDTQNNKEFSVKSKVVVNCTGIWADKVRQMDQPDAEPRIVGSRGTHVVFKKHLLPDDYAIINPNTTDGRLLFVITYLGHPMAGTTDVPCPIDDKSEPTQEEIDLICE